MRKGEGERKRWMRPVWLRSPRGKERVSKGRRTRATPKVSGHVTLTDARSLFKRLYAACLLASCFLTAILAIPTADDLRATVETLPPWIPIPLRTIINSNIRTSRVLVGVPTTTRIISHTKALCTRSRARQPLPTMHLYLPMPMNTTLE